MNPLFIITAIAIVGLIVAFFTATWVGRKDPGNAKMQAISGAIREGAIAFLNRQYRVLVWFVLGVAILLSIFVNWQTAVAFILGAFLSALAGNIGMRSATKANTRTAAAKTLDESLRISFRSGTVMGLTIASLGILGIVGLMFFYDMTGQTLEQVTHILFGFGFGASSIGLFCRVGGGIYTKAADVGADLVGKVEAGIPEDDPRNPAVIADNVGDNVGDVAGMGADLFESYVGAILAAMALGYLTFESSGVALVLAGVTFPLWLAAIGLLASLAASFIVRGNTIEKAQTALRNVIIVSSALVLVVAFFMSRAMFGTLGPFWAAFTGTLAGVLIGVITEYYTSHKFRPTQHIAEASQTGAGTNLIAGLAMGMQSTVLPLLILVACAMIGYWQAGVYGVALAGVGMLATVTITMAVDTYGAVADNAGGIAEMAGLSPEVRKRTDGLDALGNTTAAIGKGFSIASAGIVSLALFMTFTTDLGLQSVGINDVTIVAGILIGAMLPFIFSSLTMEAVGRAAFVVIGEVRRQFKDKAVLAGKKRPDYGKCVDIVTKAALKEMILPGIIVVAAPVAVGILLGGKALAGMLLGSIASGALLALMMANAGGAWDNAKKYIEGGKFGGKGSAAHKAAVVGDTVGDPFKDTAGGSLNIMIKLMGIVAVLMIPILMTMAAGGLIG